MLFYEHSLGVSFLEIIFNKKNCWKYFFFIRMMKILCINYKFLRINTLLSNNNDFFSFSYTWTINVNRHWLLSVLKYDLKTLSKHWQGRIRNKSLLKYNSPKSALAHGCCRFLRWLPTISYIAFSFRKYFNYDIWYDFGI